MGQSQSQSVLTRYVEKYFGRPKVAFLSSDPKSVRLAAQAAPVSASLIEELGYRGTPRPSDEEIETVLKLMLKKAQIIGVSLDDPASAKGFWLGHSLGLLPHPGHPVEVQAYIGYLTWLVVLFDDAVGQRGEMLEEASQFQQRFFNNEPQPNILFEGIALVIRELPEHFDPILANLMQISILQFLTSNVLEQRNEFRTMGITRYGGKFAYMLRSMSGIDVCYAGFCFPKKLFPDIGSYIQALPEMAIYINICNDVFSYYKEELAGEQRNYIHNRALVEGADVFTLMKRVKTETLECVRQIEGILKGKGKYEQSWVNFNQGFIAMHTTNVRYKMSEMGLGEEHPLAAIRTKVGQLHNQIGNKQAGIKAKHDSLLN